MRPEVNSNRFEISNRFEMSFRLHGSLHGDVNFPYNGKALLHMCKCYLLINANLINAKKCYQWQLLIDASLIIAKQILLYWLLFKQ